MLNIHNVGQRHRETKRHREMKKRLKGDKTKPTSFVLLKGRKTRSFFVINFCLKNKTNDKNK